LPTPAEDICTFRRNLADFWALLTHPWVPGLAALCRQVEQAVRSGERSPKLVEAVLTAANNIQSTSR